MKTLKATIIAAILIVGQTLLAQPPGGGQGGQGGPPKMEIPNAKQIKKMVSKLADEVKMDETQEEKVVEIYTAHFEEVEEMTSGNSRPNREKMEEHKAKLEKEIKALLDDDQAKLYVAYLKKQEQNRQGPPRQ